jgi:PAS domain S-box-containing protein
MDTRDESFYFRKKNLILLFFLISLVIFFISAVYLFDYSESFRENTAKQLTTIADLKIREIVKWRNARLGDASLFYKNRDFSELALRYLRNPRDRKSRNFLLSWMAKVNSAYKYNRLEIYDSAFNYRLAYPEGIGKEQPSFFKEYKKDLKSGKIVFKDFYRDENDKKIYMMLLVPLYNELPGGKFIGTLAMRIDPKEHLYPFINQWPVPAESAEALLARREGDYAVYLNELRFRKNAPLDLRIPLTATEFAVTRGALNQEGVAEALDYKGDRVIAAIKRIPDTTWFIIAHISKAEATAPFLARLWTVAFIALLMIVTAGIVLLLLRKNCDTRIYQKRLHDAELLAVSEEKFRKLHESIIDAFIQVNMDGKIVSCNSAFMEITGYTFEELNKLTYIELTPEKWHSYEADIVEKQILKKGFSGIYEKEYRRKDGTLVPVEFRTSLLKDSTGKPSGMWAIVRDITERNRAFADLESSLNEKKELIKEIYHRTKNNMQVIISMLELQAIVLDDDKIQELFQNMEYRISAMALVHEKLFQGKNLSMINLKDYLTELVDNIMKGYGIKKDQVIIKHQMDEVDVLIDTAIPCGLVVNELVANAAKHAFSKGTEGILEIVLSRKEDGTIKIIISDDGPGIKAEEMNNSSSMGLQIVRNIAEYQMKGTIKYSPNHGTEWELIFTDNMYEQRV